MASLVYKIKLPLVSTALWFIKVLHPIGKFMKTESRTEFARDRGSSEWGSQCLMVTNFLFGENGNNF